jgi:hydrogenase nickel incorporation protein HypA/HybF
MHERKLFEDFMSKIESVAVAQGATRVTAVRARVGELSHLTPDHFREHFVDASRGTLAEGAAVDVEIIPGTTHPLAQELVLESIEIES